MVKLVAAATDFTDLKNKRDSLHLTKWVSVFQRSHEFNLFAIMFLGLAALLSVPGSRRVCREPCKPKLFPPLILSLQRNVAWGVQSTGHGLFICQPWQDNEYRLVHSLIVRVTILIVIDNRLRKQPGDSDIPHRVVDTVNYRLSVLTKCSTTFIILTIQFCETRNLAPVIWVGDNLICFQSRRTL